MKIGDSLACQQVNLNTHQPENYTELQTKSKW